MKLIAYWTANRQYPNACHTYCVDFPKYFLWDKTGRLWKPRAKYKSHNTSPPQYDSPKLQYSAVGRIYNISSREGERHFTWTILLDKSGVTSFANMCFQEGLKYQTIRGAYCTLGLLSDDAEQSIQGVPKKRAKSIRLLLHRFWDFSYNRYIT